MTAEWCGYNNNGWKVRSAKSLVWTALCGPMSLTGPHREASRAWDKLLLETPHAPASEMEKYYAGWLD